MGKLTKSTNTESRQRSNELNDAILQHKLLNSTKNEALYDTNVWQKGIERNIFFSILVSMFKNFNTYFHLFLYIFFVI
jgi:hypothetical protein